MTLRRNNEMVDTARQIAVDVLRPWAGTVDRENRFPEESVAALREAGLLAYFVPRPAGGLGGDLRTYSRVASALGAECLSTAMIWVMHAHQVAVLADHRAEGQLEHLERIAARGALVASVTSEYGKGGDVLRAEAPLKHEGDKLRVRRRAPVVSYGGQAEYFLVTMRTGEDRPPTDTSLVLVRSDDPGVVQTHGDWQAMGLHGTRSVPMEFDLLVDMDRLVGDSFRKVALMTLVPAAQVGWTAAWLGAARGAFTRFVDRLRRQHSPRLSSDHFLCRLAELRVSLDLTQAILEHVAGALDRLRDEKAPPSAYEDAAHNIAVNNLKIAGSRLPFEVVDGLIELAGMNLGYLEEDELGLERVFRDLRSATLMFHNERLLKANGRLLLLERTPVARIWQHQD